MDSNGLSGTLRFEHFTIDAARGVVLRDGAERPLRPQSFRVLQHLAANPDRLVGKEELFDAIWGDAVVTDDSLAQCLVDIRRALGDRGRQVIRTVPRRGYIFAAGTGSAAQADGAGESAGETAAAAQGSDAGSAARATAPEVPFPQLATAAEPPAQALPMHGPRYRHPALAALALLLLLVAGAWLAGPGDEAASGALPTSEASPVVAVMPFADFTAERDMAYLAQGLPEEIIHTLTRLQGLRVIARTSSFLPRFSEGQTAMEIGAQLAATHLLEGSIREDQGILRVNVQLIDTRSGHHLWSRAIDRPQADMLRVQSQLAADIAELFRLTVMETFDDAGVVDAADYDRYLRAAHVLRKKEFQRFAEVAQTLEGVLQRNPGFLPAAVSLAEAYQVQHELGAIATDAAAGRLRALARAVDAMPGGTASAHWIRGGLALNLENDLRAAAQHVAGALAAAPGDARYLAAAAKVALALQRAPAAIRLYQAALDLDPFCIGCHIYLAHASIVAGNLTRAEQTLSRFMELTLGGHFSLALVRAWQGRFEAAQQLVDMPVPPSMSKYRTFYQALLCEARGDARCFRRLLDDFESSHGEAEPLRVAQLHAVAGDQDLAFAALARLRERNPRQLLAHLDYPLFDNLRDDPRWQRMLVELGRAPGQLASIPFDVDALLAAPAAP